MKRTILITVLALLLAHDAGACSCTGPWRWFLVTPEAVLPANNLIIPFYTLPSPFRDQVPTADNFRVDRLVDGDTVRVNFDFELVESTPVGPNVGLVGLVDAAPKSRYLVSYDGAGFSKRVRYIPAITYSVVVIAGTDSLKWDSSEDSSIEVTVSERNVQVMTLLGSCDVTVNAVTADLELLLPEALNAWSHVLLFGTEIEGVGPWRPKRSLCADYPVGRTWTGPRSDLLFATDEVHEGAEFNLDRGDYKVTMTAWVPGTDFTSRASRTISLVK